MALNPIDRLRILKQARRLAVERRASLDQGVADLCGMNPEATVQLTALFAATTIEFDACIARINTAIGNVTVSNAERVAFAQAAEAEAKG